MKILSVRGLAITEVTVIRFGRFADARGYFTEPYRQSDFHNESSLAALHGKPFVQANESYSRKGVVRGLHFQWKPYMGKLVRTIHGRMIDLVMDIRLGSPTFGKILAHDMRAREDDDSSEWIYVPPGFAHGNVFLENTTIEYMCTGEYSPGNEAAISVLDPTLDWSWGDSAHAKLAQEIIARAPLISDKDRGAPLLSDWNSDPRSKNFMYGEC